MLQKLSDGLYYKGSVFYCFSEVVFKFIRVSDTALTQRFIRAFGIFVYLMCLCDMLRVSSWFNILFLPQSRKKYSTQELKVLFGQREILKKTISILKQFLNEEPDSIYFSIGNIFFQGFIGHIVSGFNFWSYSFQK
jgi:hypothetical protein